MLFIVVSLFVSALGGISFHKALCHTELQYLEGYIAKMGADVEVDIVKYFEMKKGQLVEKYKEFVPDENDKNEEIFYLLCHVEVLEFISEIKTYLNKNI